MRESGESEGYWKSCAQCAKHLDEIHDDNKDIIEDDVRETNVRTFVEVTDIAKIVRKKICFWSLEMKTHKVEQFNLTWV